MPSERIQRQIDRLLDETEAAGAQKDWATVRDRAEHVLTYDPENEDARAFLAAAERALAVHPPAAPATPEPSPGSSPALRESGGAKTFANGRYEVLSVLGQGGMGTVYQVRDTRLDRIVALKTIRPEHLTYPEASGRFFREAQALAKLNHPNILTLFESGQDGDTHYLVMELGGPDLEALLEFAAGPLPLQQVLDVGVG